MMLRYLVMAGESDRLMTDSGQAELAYFEVTMAGSGLKSAQRKKSYIVETNCHASIRGLHDKC